jgi:hypothetical protein
MGENAAPDPSTDPTPGPSEDSAFGGDSTGDPTDDPFNDDYVFNPSAEDAEELRALAEEIESDPPIKPGEMILYGWLGYKPAGFTRRRYHANLMARMHVLPFAGRQAMKEARAAVPGGPFEGFDVKVGGWEVPIRAGQLLMQSGLWDRPGNGLMLREAERAYFAWVAAGDAYAAGDSIETAAAILDSKMEGRLFSDVVDKFVRARANGYFDNVDEDGFPILPDVPDAPDTPPTATAFDPDAVTDEDLDDLEEGAFFRPDPDGRREIFRTSEGGPGRGISRRLSYLRRRC